MTATPAVRACVVARYALTRPATAPVVQELPAEFLVLSRAARMPQWCRQEEKGRLPLADADGQNTGPRRGMRRVLRRAAPLSSCR